MVQDVNELKQRILGLKQKLADKLCTIQELEEKYQKSLKMIQLFSIDSRDLKAEIERMKSLDVTLRCDDKENKVK